MPRKIIGSAFMTLDGVIQAPGGPNEDTTGGFANGGWVFRVWDEGVDAAIGDIFDRDYDLLLGRRTYDIFAAHWPYVEGPEAPMGEAFSKANKYVLTRGDQPLEWANSHRMAGVEDVAKIKAGEGPDIIIQGSGTIYPALLAAGLLDELTLMIMPITVGPGKGLFGPGTPAGMFELVRSTVTDKGTVIATYKPGGALPPVQEGAPEQSGSAREQERQRRMAQGTW